jgi:hypothetical protein
VPTPRGRSRRIALERARPERHPGHDQRRADQQPDADSPARDMALEQRAHRAGEFAIDGIRHGEGTPDTVAEHFRLTQARLDGEAGWARALIERLRAGEYWFEGEPDRPWSAPPASGGRAGTVAGAEPKPD